METEFLGGVLVGAAIMFLPVLSVDHTSAWYRNGYQDGYEKGRREVFLQSHIVREEKE